MARHSRPDRIDFDFGGEKFEAAIAHAADLFAEIGDRTSDGVGVTRASYGEGEQLAHDKIASEAEALGLEIARDAALNLYATLPGTDRSARRILVGSHLDSVAQGGNFDGLAGVLAGLGCLEVLSSHRRLSRDVTVVALRSEENAWFGAQHVGSRAALGTLSFDALASRRADSGKTLKEHMAAAGADLTPIMAGARLVRPDSIYTFLECHIEQGSVLIERAAPLGIVTSIRGALRCGEAECLGAYGHAGVVPRGERQDAVMAACELVKRMDDFWMESEARGDDLVVTIGRFFTDPTAHGLTVIPGKVSFAVDARSHSPTVLDRFWRMVESASAAIAGRRRVSFHLPQPRRDAPVLMDERVCRELIAVCGELQIPATTLVSGAGHDSGDFAAAGIPTGLVFIRSRNGSHNPDEAMEIEDFAVAVKLLVQFVARIAQ